MDNWIKIEDRMPEKDFGKFLVTNGTEVGESTWVRRTKNEDPHFLFTQIKNITHWMPLPEPPKPSHNG